MSEDYYPPGAFYFSLSVLGSATPLAMLTDIDASFQEASGIQAEFEVESLSEGGENRFSHQLPKAAKYTNLQLKRGVVTQDSFIGEWVGLTVGANLSLPIVPQNLLLTLLSQDGVPSIAWLFVNAYPVRWETAAMNSQENKLLTETLEFSYNYFERITLGSTASVAIKMAQLAARFA